MQALTRPESTEEKKAWCELGLEQEYKFVDSVCPALGISACMNPEKKTNPYVPDIYVKEKLSDLKYQGTPFFTAGIQWGISPRYAVSFNLKDFVRYSTRYPEIMVYFWIHWEVLEYQLGDNLIKVPMLRGVWETPFQELKKEVKRHPIVHYYAGRCNDNQGNAKDSFILDIRKFTCLTSSDS